MTPKQNFFRLKKAERQIERFVRQANALNVLPFPLERALAGNRTVDERTKEPATAS
jgi:hypothetical protein